MSDAQVCNPKIQAVLDALDALNADNRDAIFITRTEGNVVLCVLSKDMVGVLDMLEVAADHLAEHMCDDTPTSSQ